MIKKHKKYAKPKKIFDSTRIQEENKLVSKYGLKNKKEIWKTNSKIAYFRTRAKNLISSSQEEQQTFFNKLNSLGLKVNSIADVLALGMDNLLSRRLSSIVYKKNLANTPKQARQVIVHKKVAIGNRIVNVPGYIVRVSEENSLSLKEKKDKAKPAEISEEKTDNEKSGNVDKREDEIHEEQQDKPEGNEDGN